MVQYYIGKIRVGNQLLTKFDDLKSEKATDASEVQTLQTFPDIVGNVIRVFVIVGNMKACIKKFFSHREHPNCSRTVILPLTSAPTNPCHFIAARNGGR